MYYIKCGNNDLDNERSLEELCAENEVVMEFYTTESYRPLYYISRFDGNDIMADLDETLYRLLKYNMDDEVYSIMGAYIPDDEDIDRLYETEEYIQLDLGYVIDGEIVQISQMA